MKIMSMLENRETDIVGRARFALYKLAETAAEGRIPFAVKIGFTAVMAVLIPVYWANYGPLNFLYFCDLALLLTLAGLWLESPLLISMPAVGILGAQLIWILDFVCGFAGIHLLGMTDYMFDASKPLYLRGLSLFHVWLPLLLIYLVPRTGYDRRAFVSWTALAWTVMTISYFFLPAPSPEMANAVANVDYVYGFGSTEPQHMMPGWMWFSGLMVLFPALLVAPVHVILTRLFGRTAPSKGGDKKRRTWM